MLLNDHLLTEGLRHLVVGTSIDLPEGRNAIIGRRSPAGWCLLG
jgi:hypothetical protein